MKTYVILILKHRHINIEHHISVLPVTQFYFLHFFFCIFLAFWHNQHKKTPGYTTITTFKPRSIGTDDDLDPSGGRELHALLSALLSTPPLGPPPYQARLNGEPAMPVDVYNDSSEKTCWEIHQSDIV